MWPSASKPLGSLDPKFSRNNAVDFTFDAWLPKMVLSPCILERRVTLRPASISDSSVSAFTKFIPISLAAGGVFLLASKHRTTAEMSNNLGTSDI